MVDYTKQEAMVAKELMSSRKTLEELCKATALKKTEVTKALKKLEKVKMAKKFGTHYAIAEEVKRGIRRKKDWEFKAHIIIEGQSKNKASMEKSQKDLLNRLNTDKIVDVTDVIQHEITHEEGTYNSLFECDVLTKTFEDMMYVVLNYGPSSIMLEEPSKYTSNTSEMNGVLMDAATVIHMYVNMIVDLKQQLDKERITIK